MLRRTSVFTAHSAVPQTRLSCGHIEGTSPGVLTPGSSAPDVTVSSRMRNAICLLHPLFQNEEVYSGTEVVWKMEGKSSPWGAETFACSCTSKPRGGELAEILIGKSSHSHVTKSHDAGAFVVSFLPKTVVLELGTYQDFPD